MRKQTLKQLLLEQYIPWAKDVDQIVTLLKEMEVPDFEYADVVRGNAVHVYGQLVNPDNGEAVPVGIATIQIKTTESGYGLTVNDVPFRQFFADLEREDANIKDAAAQNETVSKLWEENKRLKLLLGTICRFEK